MPPRKRTKRTKRDADPPVEAPVEVLVEEQKPFPLLMLPQLVLHLIFSCLKPSEMDGISRSSTFLRSLLLPYVFYAVRFEGTEAEVSGLLEAFLYHRRQRFMKPLWESVRCFTVSPHFERDNPWGTEVMKKLPSRILEGLRRTARVRTIVLDLNTMAYALQERLANSLKASSGWPEVTTLRVTASGRDAEIIAHHWLPSHFNYPAPWGITVSGTMTGYSSVPFRAMKNRAGQLTRLYLGYNLLVIETMASVPGLLTPWVGEEVCKELEWFVMRRFSKWSKTFRLGTLNSVSDSEQLTEGTQNLVKILAMMPRLRRFAFGVDRRRLGPCLVRQVWTMDCEPLTSAEVDDWYKNLVKRIARSLPKLKQLGIMDYKGAVYIGTRASEGHDMTVSHEILEAGSQRFPQGIDD
ncbi:hypothetical protein CEP54_004816 [Fusarium duplospermum]|uniref:F-box domain-containing protein n=1 Tax=Fusarium duplospermum TaxID=1325734 RepID=A0A428QGH2_9HYPO|nr:hypothetical protein CEP54_004816 [Fusarium duplospermum]